MTFDSLHDAPPHHQHYASSMHFTLGVLSLMNFELLKWLQLDTRDSIHCMVSPPHSSILAFNTTEAELLYISSVQL